MADQRPQAVPHCLLIFLFIMAIVVTTTVLTVLPLAVPSAAAAETPGAVTALGDRLDCPAAQRGVAVIQNRYRAFAGTNPCRSSVTTSESTGSSGPKKPRVCAEAIAATSALGLAGQLAANAQAIQGVPVVCTAARRQINAPTVTPAQLAARAQKALGLPLPDVRTAPPRGADGMVGLPEWVWLASSQWHAVSRRASAGGVWAEVTASPQRIVIQPGVGLGSVGCDGPGIAYDPGRPASAQSSGCSYTYNTSSAGQPKDRYTMTVTVVWIGTWQGSGGAGGTLPAIS